MRLARVLYKSKVYWSRIDEDTVLLLGGKPYEGPGPVLRRLPLAQVKLLVPAEPSKIVLAGLNYREHARELKMPVPEEPVIFLKPPSSLIAHNEGIIYPAGVSRLDFEAELAIVIKKRARAVAENKAKEFILGFTCLNDITARDLQKKDVQWTRAKSFDTFCAVGPWIETRINAGGLRVRSYLNKELRQDGSTADFIFNACRLLSFISSVMTLEPGDIISTGTPSGVGSMRPGDEVEVDISGIGRLKNFVCGHRKACVSARNKK